MKLAHQDFDTETERKASGPGSNDFGNDGHVKAYAKTLRTEPQIEAWSIFAVGAAVPIGLAAAAVATSYLSSQKQVGLAAWVAVAVVGTASVISAASISHRRSLSIDKDRRGMSRGDQHREDDVSSLSSAWASTHRSSESSMF